MAETRWGWLYISLLWVDESQRGVGVGTRPMKAGEAEAIRRGCGNAFLDTFSFQARPFYEGLGFSVFGELEEFPSGHQRYFLRKQLSADGRLGRG